MASGNLTVGLPGQTKDDRVTRGTIPPPPGFEMKEPNHEPSLFAPIDSVDTVHPDPVDADSVVSPAETEQPMAAAEEILASVEDVSGAVEETQDTVEEVAAPADFGSRLMDAIKEDQTEAIVAEVFASDVPQEPVVEVATPQETGIEFISVNSYNSAIAHAHQHRKVAQYLIPGPDGTAVYLYEPESDALIRIDEHKPTWEEKYENYELGDHVDAPSDYQYPVYQDLLTALEVHESIKEEDRPIHFFVTDTVLRKETGLIHHPYGQYTFQWIEDYGTYAYVPTYAIQLGMSKVAYFLNYDEMLANTDHGAEYVVLLDEVDLTNPEAKDGIFKVNGKEYTELSFTPEVEGTEETVEVYVPDSVEETEEVTEETPVTEEVPVKIEEEIPAQKRSLHFEEITEKEEEEVMEIIPIVEDTTPILPTNPGKNKKFARRADFDQPVLQYRRADNKALASWIDKIVTSYARSNPIDFSTLDLPGVTIKANGKRAASQGLWDEGGCRSTGRRTTAHALMVADSNYLPKTAITVLHNKDIVNGRHALVEVNVGDIVAVGMVEDRMKAIGIYEVTKINDETIFADQVYMVWGPDEADPESKEYHLIQAMEHQLTAEASVYPGYVNNYRDRRYIDLVDYQKILADQELISNAKIYPSLKEAYADMAAILGPEVARADKLQPMLNMATTYYPQLGKIAVYVAGVLYNANKQTSDGNHLVYGRVLLEEGDFFWYPDRPSHKTLPYATLKAWLMDNNNEVINSFRRMTEVDCFEPGPNE